MGSSRVTDQSKPPGRSLTFRTSFHGNDRTRSRPLLLLFRLLLAELHLHALFFSSPSDFPSSRNSSPFVDLRKGYLNKIPDLRDVKVLAVHLDSRISRLSKHSSELLLRLQHLLQSLPLQNMLKTVQIGPWETLELEIPMNTSAFKPFDIVLSDQQRTFVHSEHSYHFAMKTKL
jgi:hypothetical protein